MAQAPDREKALELALAQIEKSHGKGSVMRLGDEVRQPISVIPTGQYLDIGTAAGTQQNRVGQLEVRRAAATPGHTGADVEVELGALGDGALGREIEAEGHGVGHHGAQCADLQLHAVHAAACGVFTHRFDKTLRQRHFMHVRPALGSDETPR